MISSYTKWRVSVIVELVRATHGTTVTTRETLLHNRVVCASINEWSMSARGACDARCVTSRTRNIQQGQVWTLHFQTAFHFYRCQQSSESLDRRTRQQCPTVCNDIATQSVVPERENISQSFPVTACRKNHVIMPLYSEECFILTSSLQYMLSYIRSSF